MICQPYHVLPPIVYCPAPMFRATLFFPIPAKVAPTMLISTGSYPFIITPRFSPGHQLSESEAFALNLTFADNLRNIVSRWIKKRTDLTPEELTDIQFKLFSISTAYKFPAPFNPPESVLEKDLKAVSEEFPEISNYEIHLLARQRIAARRGVLPEGL